MVTADELDARRRRIAESVDLQRLLAHLGRRTDAFLARPLAPPVVKALLSVDGGVCPHDGTALLFDPYSPDRHRCPACGRDATGDRAHRHWATSQHLWLAERAAELATVGVLAGRTDAARAAAALLREYGERYLDYPNEDNVLGPARLFFSTYLESVWLTSYLAAASLLREADLLDRAAADAVGVVADAAATLIGEYHEGFSNRQTWNAAALTAIAVWFEDEGLAHTAINGAGGLVSHLMEGFGEDGMWYEGENYHLFALRGLLIGLGWARAADVDAAADPILQARLRLALLAPTRSVLPDLTFPARKDSRFGVSLAQPMYLELWEIGAARLAAAGDAVDDVDAWLTALYASAAPVAQPFHSYLHEAGEAAPARRSRADLSWWSALEMAPALHPSPDGWRPTSVLLGAQGLAVVRSGDRYASLECGPGGGGHGHPDRLHLTVHADGVHWLPDPGTGSYVAPDLFWYRSTLAHNAPRLGGVSQPTTDAICEAIDVGERWSRVRGRFGPLRRTLVLGPDYLVDLLDDAPPEARLLELPWHLAGAVEVQTPGRWEPAPLDEPFVTGAERFVPAAAASGAIVLHASAPNAAGEMRALRLHLLSAAELVRATGPGVPGAPAGPFYLQRLRERGARLVAVLEPVATDGAARVESVALAGDALEVHTASGIDRHLIGDELWSIDAGGTRIELRGTLRQTAAFEPIFRDRPVPPAADTPWLPEAPPLDGSLDGFVLDAPLLLELEDQYRRSEEPYAGPDQFSAQVYTGWHGSTFYIAVEVVTAAVVVRGAAAPPLRLDNEPDDIHADGLQLYLRTPDDDTVYGWLVVPSGLDDATVRVHPVSDTAADAAIVTGRWRRIEGGYAMTVGITLPEPLQPDDALGFDLIVNQTRPGRQRRAGQLVWSGGGGWIWLRGDRQDPTRFGVLRLSAG